MVVSLTSCVLTNHLFLGSRLSRRTSRKEEGSGGMREVLVEKLSVEGSGGKASGVSKYMHGRHQIALCKT